MGGAPRRTSCQCRPGVLPVRWAVSRVRLQPAPDDGRNGMPLRKEHSEENETRWARWARDRQKVEKPMIQIRAKALGALVAVLALGAVAAPNSAVAALHEPCDPNVICYYNQETYGSRANTVVNCSASGGFSTFGYKYSALNRCGNKTNWLRNSGTVIACMNPGGNRPSPGPFNEVWVAAEYGAFC